MMGNEESAANGDGLLAHFLPYCGEFVFLCLIF